MAKNVRFHTRSSGPSIGMSLILLGQYKWHYILGVYTLFMKIFNLTATSNVESSGVNSGPKGPACRTLILFFPVSLGPKSRKIWFWFCSVSPALSPVEFPLLNQKRALVGNPDRAGGRAVASRSV